MTTLPCLYSNTIWLTCRVYSATQCELLAVVIQQHDMTTLPCLFSNTMRLTCFFWRGAQSALTRHLCLKRLSSQRAHVLYARSVCSSFWAQAEQLHVHIICLARHQQWRKGWACLHVWEGSQNRFCPGMRNIRNTPCDLRLAVRYDVTFTNCSECFVLLNQKGTQACKCTDIWLCARAYDRMSLQNVTNCSECSVLLNLIGTQECKRRNMWLCARA